VKREIAIKIKIVQAVTYGSATSYFALIDEHRFRVKSTAFWDITPCGPLKVNGSFGGTSPPISGSNKKPWKKQHESRWEAELFIITEVRTSNRT
jgi:hypothetical protein